ncbi:OmpH family outer membrane protein [Phocaeicola barnesiae]|jgi:outer membrane protein|uniref:OmpH family outer membrane protein n=1 Tax=Phocaeicola barnesiae TaxID=376804 RepID=A0AAW5N2H2_9BACT|nr:OmpH family outer membrane protein [Phocaeicola barnesiae]CDD32559.1 outer membrane chaperone Skp (OmpH) [Bacteroides sp. CAG:714]MCF2576416.1 OmpH family outer membrane protein [Phocaeicola barnesiae]MCF2597794.1 OmpH family outer membrane protein [Phocaeicola barnesiae]MCR8874587.1 OmpH family outer membrane protein [Phocaeicola barnesiae]MDM8232104.1 OmpH family outer membrane protein [Phocaeicola barnesiae]
MKKVILTIIIALTGMITAQAQRFALIDMEYILKHIPAYEQANRQMESLSQQYQKEIEAKGQEAKSLYEAYQQSASTLSDSQRTEKENAIVAKEKEAADLRARYFGPEGEMAKKQKELITPIQDAIYNAVKTVATQQGYDVVFDRASDQSMIFASPRIDISNEILSKLGYSN